MFLLDIVWRIQESEVTNKSLTNQNYCIMELEDKTRVYPLRPYEKKAINFVNQKQVDDRWMGVQYNECEEHLIYCGYIGGYERAIADATALLRKHGINNINLQNILLYGTLL